MLNKIRTQLMADTTGPLKGVVEADETSVDGKLRKPQGDPIKKPGTRSNSMQHSEKRRATVFAAVERGGRIKATVFESRRGPHIKQQVIEWVEPRSIVVTDEWPAYNGLHNHFAGHKRINHSANMYVDGGVYTNTVEGFFGNLKTGIRGNYKKVSHKWLQSYLNEFTWRYNHRNETESMFHLLVKRAALAT